MKFIQKNSPPSELENWKMIQLAIGVNCNFKSLRNPEKGIVHQSLLIEQGFICCYCCQRITKEISHIEHFDPQSKIDDLLSITYTNLLASCSPFPPKPEDPEKKPTHLDHCGNKRKNKNLPISPLDPTCEDYFTYTSQGEIRPRNSSPIGVQETIDALNLNHRDLTLSRQKALDALIGIDDAEARSLCHSCYCKNQQDEFEPFCIAVADYLRQNFSIP